MTVNIPESIDDITLEQFQKYTELEKRDDLNEISLQKRIVSIFTNLKYRDVDKIPQRDFEDILSQIQRALNQDVEFKNRFKMHDIEFGIIPNFDEITLKEYVDISTYGVKVETLHNLMAVLFRPLRRKNVFNDYEIEDYTGTKKYAEAMKYMPLSIVNGALVFFFNLSRELRSYIQKSTAQQLAKEKQQAATLKSGDGIQQSMN